MASVSAPSDASERVPAPAGAPVPSLVERFKALADPARLAIVDFLAAPDPACCAVDDAVCACDLETLTGLSQPTVSHHMRILVGAGLVRAEKRGRWMHYELRRADVAAVRDAIGVWLETSEARDGRRASGASASGGGLA